MENNPESSGCILVLCGLPGSGKTTLCREICRHFNKTHHLFEDSCLVVPVCYDEILTADLEQRLVERIKLQAEAQKYTARKCEESSEWKNYRHGILDCVDKLLDILLNQKAVEKPEQVEEEMWIKFTSGVVMDKLVTVDMETKPKHVVIAIDDNMYYSSMRYQYFQLARKYYMGFCQAYLSCDVEESTRRNALRVESVPSHVITDMAVKFEEPDPNKNKWERNSLILPSTETREVGGVLDLIDRALHDPVLAIEETDKAEQAESRMKCSQSVLHQIDQILRKIVTQKILQAKGNLARHQIRYFASQINTVKTDLYAGLKEGSITLPGKLLETATDASKDKDSPLYVFVEEQFQCLLGEKGCDDRTSKD